MGLVVDSGPLIALLLRSDPRHEECVALLTDPGDQRVVPTAVLAEVDFMCRRAGEPEAFPAFLLDCVRGGFELADLRAGDYLRIRELLATYADLRVGFVDAAVLAIVERLGEEKVATLDHRHFGAMRPRHTGSLELLPA